MMKGSSQYSRPTTAKKPMGSPKSQSRQNTERVKTEAKGEDYQALMQQM